MKSARYLLLIVIFLGLAGPSMAFYIPSGCGGDTTSGTALTALATNETIDYKDGNATAMTQVVCATTETKTTTTEYGLNWAADTPADQPVTPGSTIWNSEYLVSNCSNTTESVKFKSRFDHYNSAAGWVVELWLSSTRLATLSAGSVNTYDIPGGIPQSDTYPLKYKVIVSSESGSAPNGSYITIVSTYETTNTPVITLPGYNYYTGGNYYDYGGRGAISDEVRDTVGAPILTLTRTSTTDAPTAFTGGTHDAVPGAVITFTMNYSNTGAASAESVILVDKIPTNTKLAHINTTSTAGSVKITAAQGTASGWTVYYNSVDDTLDSAKKAYGYYTNWNSIGTIEPSSKAFPGGSTCYTDAGGGAYTAKWVKWEKLYVASAEAKSLTWGVTIR